MVQGFDPKASAGSVETKWHVQGLVPEGLCQMAGAPGTAKSMLAEYLAWCTAYEKPFLDLPTRPGSVIYVNNDHTEDNHNSWWVRFSNGAGITHSPEHPLIVKTYRWTNLRDPKSEYEFLTDLHKYEPKLVVIDRLSSSFVVNENHSWDMEPVGVWIRDWIYTYQTAVISVHHLSKGLPNYNPQWLAETFGQRLRGSSAILGMSDAAMELMTLKTDNGKLSTFGVRPHPKRAPVINPFRVNIWEASKHEVVLEREPGWNSTHPDMAEMCALILEIFEDNNTQSVLSVDKTFKGYYDIKDIREAMHFLVKGGKLELLKKGVLRLT